MKQKLIGYLNKFSGRLNTNRLMKLTGQKILLPAYHVVSDAKLPHIDRLYAIRSTSLFKKDLDFFLKHFKPIDLQELLEIVRSGRKPEKACFHLSFDDGLREMYDVVYPVLKEKGIPASFFLNTDFIDNKNLFFRMKISLILNKLNEINGNEIQFMNKPIQREELLSYVKGLGYWESDKIDQMASCFDLDFKLYLQDKQPYLSSSQIREMMYSGFSFGAHSKDHPDYRELEVVQQIIQTKESVEFINAEFDAEIRSFAFPFTDHEVSAMFFEKLEKYDLVDLSFGVAGLKKDAFNFHLQRIPMERSLLSAQTIINTEYLYYLMKMPFGKNNIVRK